MSHIKDLKLIIETLKKSPPDGDSLIRIADAVVYSDPYHFKGWYDHVAEMINPPDIPGGPEIIAPAYDIPRDPDNEEKAELVNKTVLKFLKTMVREHAEANQREVNKRNSDILVKSVGDAAEKDLNF